MKIFGLNLPLPSRDKGTLEAQQRAGERGIGKRYIGFAIPSRSEFPRRHLRPFAFAKCVPNEQVERVVPTMHAMAWSLLKRRYGFVPMAVNLNQAKEVIMLQAAAVFFIIAIIAAIFGFGGIAAGATEIAKILFFIFLIVFIVSLIMGLMRR